MIASSSQIRADAPVYVLFGESRVLRERALDEILTARLSLEDRHTSVTRLRGPDVTVEVLRQETASLSLLSPQRVVIIEGAEDLPADVQEQVAKAIPSLPPGVALVLVTEVAPGHQPPLSASLLEAIKEAKGQAIACSPGGKGQVAPALVREAERQGKRLPLRTAQRLLEATGGDFDAACRELDKVVLYVGAEATISSEDVEAVVSASAEGNQFAFADAVGMRDSRTALRVLDDLLPPGTKRGAAIPVLGMLARQLRLVWQAKVLQTVGPQQRASLRQRLPEGHNYWAAVAGRGWLADKLQEQAKAWTEEDLARSMILLYETDRRLKGRTEEQIEDRLAMELLIAQLCR